MVDYLDRRGMDSAGEDGLAVVSAGSRITAFIRGAAGCGGVACLLLLVIIRLYASLLIVIAS